MSKIIGITGGIATGKSYISKLINDKGYTVYDADIIAHDILNTERVSNKIIKNFGSSIVSGKKVDRKKLGKIVFNNSNKLDLLNSIMMKDIKLEILSIIEKEKNNNKSKLSFIEIPLLFEQNFEQYLDAVILVYSDSETQISRLISRDNITEEFAHNKISSQMDMSEKIGKADFIINNSIDKFEDNKINEIINVLKNN